MEWYQLSNEAEIASPALVLHTERIEANLQRMLAIAGDVSRLRPHVKTHKLGPLVARQMELGIRKFKCATVAEAEMCAQTGAPDVLLALVPVGPNIARLCALAQRYPETRFSTLFDDPAALRALGAAAQADEMTMDVYLDVDCGQRRTGVPADENALAICQLAGETAGVKFLGLHAYDGHIHEADAATRRNLCAEAFAPVEALRSKLNRAGFERIALIAGGTPTFPFHAEKPDRECSPGTTVLWDFGYGDKFADLPFLPAAVLLTRVVSKPGEHRLCLDLGHKAVAAENPHPRVRILDLPDAAAVLHSEEHLVVETPRAGEFPVGAMLHGIPRHVCPTVALYSEATVARGGAAVGQWTIEARARRLSV